MKKILLVIVSVLSTSILISCGASNNAQNNTAQVEDLQKQIEDLQQQLNQQQVQQNTQYNQQQDGQNINQQAGQQVGQQINQQFGGNQMNANISLEQAKQIATSNAGLDVNSVTFIKTMQDYDDGYMKWDVDFVAGNTKYDYDISMYDGTILKAEREAIAMQEGYVPPVQGNMQGVVTGQGTVGGQGIDVETAKNIAVTHSGFNMASVTFVKQKYDFDDGIAKWEIEFVNNTSKYEYEINAANGAIVKYKVESIYND